MSRELPELGRPFWAFSQHGHLGVQFFFALSGFIILYVHAVDVGHPPRVVHYLRNRFVRIFPIYWIVLAGVALGILLKNAQGLSDINSVAAWVSQVTLLKLETGRVVVGHAWTLFHEMFFYLLFAIAIVNRRIGLPLLGAWLCSILYFWELQDNLHEVRDVLVGVNNLFFFAGMAAFWVTSKLSAKAAWAMLASGIALLLVGSFFHEQQNILGLSLTFVWFASFTAIIAGACAMERTGQIAGVPRVLELLGDASYSIYLVHWHFQTYALRAVNRFIQPDAASAPVVWIFLMVLSLAAGCALYWWVERPILKFLKRGRKVPVPAVQTAPR